MVALGLDQRLFLPRWMNGLGFLRSSPPGFRGSAYIVLPNEYGSSDQTDLNRTNFINPLSRWSMIREAEPDWLSGQGGRPAPRSTRSYGFWTLLDVGYFRGTLISLCKPDVWAFPPYFLITPYRNRQTPKLVEFCQIKP